MPTKEVLERYDVLQFHELASAIKDGNVRRFDEVIQRHESFFIEHGIYLIVEKLKIIGYRNLFKKVCGRILRSPQYHYCLTDRFIRLGTSAHPNASIGPSAFSLRLGIRWRNRHFHGRNSLHCSESNTRRENQRLHIASAQQASRVQTKSISCTEYCIVMGLFYNLDNKKCEKKI